MPIFGDIHVFAIEALVETGLLWSPSCPSELSGRLRVWIRGCPLGDLDDWGCWLRPPMEHFVDAVNALDRRWHEVLATLGPEDRFDRLDRWFYAARRGQCLAAGLDDDARAQLDQAIESELAACPIQDPTFLTNSSEAFDGFKAFLLRPPGACVQVLWLREGSPMVHSSEFGAAEFENVVRRFAAWVQLEERSWQEERQERWGP